MKMKRILSVLLSLLCLLLCIPFTTGAVESEPEILFWEQAVSRYPAGYSEDYNGNVFITTGEGLAWLISAVNGLNNNTPNTFEGKTVTLGNSIDLSAYYWTPVGNAANPFKGTFNGAGFQITGLRFNFDDTGYSDVGFFGYLLQGKICNVLVETSQFYFRSRNDQPLRVGGLCGSLENSTLVNVSFCGTITGALTTEKDLYVGGLCGVSLNSKVYNSYTVSNVTAIGISRVFSGGLSGFLNGGELLNMGILLTQVSCFCD